MANIRRKDNPPRSILRKIIAVIQKNKSQIFFVFAVGITMVLYYSITGTQWFRQGVLPSYLQILAEITSYVLQIMGEKVSTIRTVVQSPAFSMDIAYGCDALEPITLFSVVVACYPVKVYGRIIGVIAGVCVLFVLNIVRLLTLYYTGTYSQELFELFHIEIWQPVFILCALVLFVLYVGIMRKKGWSNG